VQLLGKRRNKTVTLAFGGMVMCLNDASAHRHTADPTAWRTTGSAPVAQHAPEEVVASAHPAHPTHAQTAVGLHYGAGHRGSLETRGHQDIRRRVVLGLGNDPSGMMSSNVGSPSPGGAAPGSRTPKASGLTMLVRYELEYRLREAGVLRELEASYQAPEALLGPLLTLLARAVILNLLSQGSVF
jgi:hypothetical protein